MGTAIDLNPTLLGLTGGSRGITRVQGTPYQYTGGVIDTTTETPTRAIDNAPRAQMFAYEEYIPSQAGREAGYSTKSLIA